MYIYVYTYICVCVCVCVCVNKERGRERYLDTCIYRVRFRSTPITPTVPLQLLVATVLSHELVGRGMRVLCGKYGASHAS